MMGLSYHAELVKLARSVMSLIFIHLILHTLFFVFSGIKLCYWFGVFTASYTHYAIIHPCNVTLVFCWIYMYAVIITTYLLNVITHVHSWSWVSPIWTPVDCQDGSMSSYHLLNPHFLTLTPLVMTVSHIESTTLFHFVNAYLWSFCFMFLNLWFVIAIYKPALSMYFQPNINYSDFQHDSPCL